MGDMFQLSIELYDNKDEKLLWSDRWQESWENLPSIKNNLSDGLLKALNTKPKEENKEYTSNSEAYEYYLKAVFKWEKRELVNDTVVVRELLNKSIEIDDDFLLAKNLLGKTFLVMGDYDDAMQIFSSALEQAEKLDDKKNLVRSLNSIGEIYLVKEGNKDRALKYFEKSLSISKGTGDKSGMGDCYEKLGSIYGQNNEFLKSIEYFEKSLAIFNELDKKNMVISSINNIGVTYYRKNEYDKSLEYFEKQLKMVKELGWKSGIAQAHSNIAFIYNSKGDYRKAIELHQKALDIYEKLDEKRSTSHTLYSIGHLYFNVGELDKALELFFRSSKMNEESGVKPMIARDYNRIGAVYYEKGNYTEAAKFIDDSLSIHKELDEKVHFSITTAHLHICYKHLGKEYDNNELNNFINHFNIDEIPDRDNFILYKVLGNKSCLKAGYNQICKIANAMEDDLKEQFLNYPNSKRIIEEYEKVFN